MTECEYFGYKEGDSFEAIENTRVINGGLKKGEILTLTGDDGTDRPLFTKENGDTAFIYLRHIKKIGG